MVKITCPLGSVCEEIKDNVQHRCAWYTKIQGRDAQGKTHDDWNCAITWNPILQLEVATTNRGVSASVQSLRNVNDVNQKAAITALKEVSNDKIDHP